MKSKKFNFLIVAIMLVTVIFSLSACQDKNPLAAKSTFTVTFMDGDELVSSAAVDFGAKAPLPSLSKEGYAFVNWYTDKDCTTLYDRSEITSDITLYAKFNKKELYITVNTDGGNKIEPILVEENMPYTIPAPEKAGYNFLGYTYYNDVEDVDFPLEGTYSFSTSIRIRANWEKIVEKLPTFIVFNTNGGNKIARVSVEKDAPYSIPAPTKAGYDFIGYTYYNDVEEVDFPLEGIYSFDYSITIRANWVERIEKEPICITFNTAGGTKIDPIQINKGDSYSLSTPTRTGYNFLGYIYDNGIEDVSFPLEGTYPFDYSIKLRAVWELHFEEEQLCININPNGGTNIDAIFIEADNSYSLPDLERTGYTFKGYSYYNGTNEVTFPKSGTYPYDYSITVRAVWEENEPIYITINANGGNNISPILVEQNKGYDLPTPERTGYTFKGYTYYNGESEVDFQQNGTYQYDYSITIRANWEIQTNTIGLSGEGGGGDESTLLFVDNGSYFKERNSLSEEFTYVFTTGSTASFNGVTISVGNTSLVELSNDGTSFTVGNEPGEFTIFVNKNGDTYNRNARIVKQVYSFASGLDYLSTSQESLNASDFMIKAKTPMLVGRENFIPDLNIKDALSQTLNYKTVRLLVEVKDGDNVVSVSDYSIDENGIMNFNNSLVGKTLTLTFKCKYDASSTKKTVTQTIKINNAANVYTNEQLKELFANLDIHELNILRNIVATPKGYYPGTNDPLCESGDSVYSRSNPTYVDSNIKINGNFLKIDGSNLPLINGDHRTGGWTGDNYKACNVQVALFEFANNNNNQFSSNHTFVIDNLRIESNNNPNRMNETLGDINAPTATPKLPYSGCFNGINIRGGTGEFNNVVISKARNSFWGQGQVDAFLTTPTHATIFNINDCRVMHGWSNSVYMWDVAKVDIKRTELGETNAALMHFFDVPHPQAVNHTLILDEYTASHLNNLKTGEETWFKIYSSVQAMPNQLKESVESNLQTILANAYVNKPKFVTMIRNDLDESHIEFFNFVIAVEKRDKSTTWAPEADDKGVIYLDLQLTGPQKNYDFVEDSTNLTSGNAQSQAAAVAHFKAYKAGDFLRVGYVNQGMFAYGILFDGSYNIS